MSPIRRTSIVVGVLFVVATVAGALTLVLLGPVLDDPNPLLAVSGNESGVVGAALLDLIVGVAVVGISVMLYPILKNESEGLALGYVAARTVEAVFIGIGVFSLLKLLALSQLHMDAGAPEAPYFEFHGTMLVEARERTSVNMEQSDLAQIVTQGRASVVVRHLGRHRQPPRALDIENRQHTDRTADLSCGTTSCRPPTWAGRVRQDVRGGAPWRAPPYG